MQTQTTEFKEKIKPQISFPALEIKRNYADLLSMTTKADGACAFHAALGEWDPVRKMFICNDVVAKRRVVAQAIRDAKKIVDGFPVRDEQIIKDINTNKKIYECVVEAIGDLVMDPTKSLSEGRIKEIRVQYQRLMMEESKRLDQINASYEAKIRQDPEVLDFILSQSNKTTFLAKYQELLNRPGSILKDRILRNPILKTAFHEYNRVTQQNIFDIKRAVDQRAITEYADMMSQPSQWLLPIELKLITHVFRINIQYHTLITPNQGVLTETYTPEEKTATTVSIGFDGIGHYERMITKAKREEYFRDTVFGIEQKNQIKPVVFKIEELKGVSPSPQIQPYQPFKYPVVNDKELQMSIDDHHKQHLKKIEILIENINRIAKDVNAAEAEYTKFDYNAFLTAEILKIETSHVAISADLFTVQQKYKSIQTKIEDSEPAVKIIYELKSRHANQLTIDEKNIESVVDDFVKQKFKIGLDSASTTERESLKSTLLQSTLKLQIQNREKHQEQLNSQIEMLAKQKNQLEAEKAQHQKNIAELIALRKKIAAEMEVLERIKQEKLHLEQKAEAAKIAQDALNKQKTQDYMNLQKRLLKELKTEGDKLTAQQQQYNATDIQLKTYQNGINQHNHAIAVAEQECSSLCGPIYDSELHVGRHRFMRHRRRHYVQIEVYNINPHTYNAIENMSVHDHLPKSHKMWRVRELRIAIRYHHNQVNDFTQKASETYNSLVKCGLQIAATKQTIATLEQQIQSSSAAWVIEEKQLKDALEARHFEKQQASDAVAEANKNIKNKNAEDIAAKSKLETETRELEVCERNLSEKVTILTTYVKALQNSKDKLKTLTSKLRAVSTKPKEYEFKHGLNVEGMAVELQSQFEQGELLIAQVKKDKIERENLKAQITQLQNTLQSLHEQRLLLEAKDAPIQNKHADALQEKILELKKSLQEAEKLFELEKFKFEEQSRIILLSQAQVLTGYENIQNAPAVDNLIICLLQGVFNTYPLSAMRKASAPDDWVKQIAKIKSRTQLPEQTLNAEITHDIMVSVVKAINTEYSELKRVLNVSYLSDQGMQNISCESKDDQQQIQLQLCQLKGNYLLISPDDHNTNPDPVNHEFRLRAELLSSNDTMRLFCLQLIECELNQSIDKADATQLCNFYLQLEQKCENISDHTALNKIVLYKLRSDSTPVKAATYCLDHISHLSTQLSSAKQTESLTSIKDHLLDVLKSSISQELKQRADNEISQGMKEEAKQQLTQKTLDELDRAKKSLETSITEEEKKVQIQEKELLERKKQNSEVTEEYKKQAQNIDVDIDKYKKMLVVAENEIKKTEQLKEINKEKIESLRIEKQQIIQALDELQIKKQQHLKLLEQQEEVRKKILDEQAKVALEKDLATNAKTCHEDLKKIVDNEIKHFEIWKLFFKNLNERLIHSKALFLKRKEILANLYQLLDKDDAFLAIYKYLMTEPELASLAKPEMNECILSLVDGRWLEEFTGVMNDVLADPQIILDSINHKYLVRGKNISWEQLYQQLQLDVVNRLAYYGLTFSPHQTLVVSNPILLGRIADLPPNLKNLIDHYIEVYYQGYNASSQPWPQKDAMFEQAKPVIDSLGIHFNEVLKSFAETIEVVAGHHIYVDNDIYLHGINLTLYAKEDIHCKPNLIIDTSGKPPLTFAYAKARKGSDYRAFTSQGLPAGHRGDDGLEGDAGNNAGHIVIKAERKIENFDSIKPKADGANGMAAQAAGDGDQGYKGMRSPDAVARPPYHWARAQATLAIARKYNVCEFGGTGGDSGLGGLGGEGGFPGEILIEVVSGSLQSKFVGTRGQTGADGASSALGGPGGEPGDLGLDHEYIKEGIFKRKYERRGYFDENDIHHAHMIKDRSRIPKILRHDNAPAVSIDGESSDYHIQRRSYGYYSIAGPKPQDQFNRRELSRGKKGQDNQHRRKHEALRRKPKQNQNGAIQQSHMAMMQQTATAINMNQKWLQYDKRYQERLVDLRKKSELHASEIEKYKRIELAKTAELQKIDVELKQVENELAQLKLQHQALNQMICLQAEKLNANDLEQLAQLNDICELGEKTLKLKAALGNAKIDQTSQESVKAHFDNIFHILQKALDVSLQWRNKQLSADKSALLNKTQQLEKLKEEYLRINNEYQQHKHIDKHVEKEESLRKLEQSLYVNKFENQTGEKEETIQVLITPPVQVKQNETNNAAKQASLSIRKPNFIPKGTFKNNRLIQGVTFIEKNLQLILRDHPNKIINLYTSDLLAELSSVSIAHWNLKKVKQLVKNVDAIKLTRADINKYNAVYHYMLGVYAQLIFNKINKNSPNDTTLGQIETILQFTIRNHRSGSISSLFKKMDSLLKVGTNSLQEQCKVIISESKQTEMQALTSDIYFDITKVTLDLHYHETGLSQLEKDINSYNQLNYINIDELIKLTQSYTAEVGKIIRGENQPITLFSGYCGNFIEVVLQQIKLWFSKVRTEQTWASLNKLDVLFSILEKLNASVNVYTAKSTQELFSRLKERISNEAKYHSVYKQCINTIGIDSKKSLIIKALKFLRNQAVNGDIEWYEALKQLNTIEAKINDKTLTIEMLGKIGKQQILFVDAIAFDGYMQSSIHKFFPSAKYSKEDYKNHYLVYFYDEFLKLSIEGKKDWLVTHATEFKNFINNFANHLVISNTKLDDLMILYRKTTHLSAETNQHINDEHMQHTCMLPLLTLSEMLDKQIISHVVNIESEGRTSWKMILNAGMQARLTADLPIPRQIARKNYYLNQLVKTKTQTSHEILYHLIIAGAKHSYADKSDVFSHEFKKNISNLGLAEDKYIPDDEAYFESLVFSLLTRSYQIQYHLEQDETHDPKDLQDYITNLSMIMKEESATDLDESFKHICSQQYHSLYPLLKQKQLTSKINTPLQFIADLELLYQELCIKKEEKVEFKDLQEVAENNEKFIKIISNINLTSYKWLFILSIIKNSAIKQLIFESLIKKCDLDITNSKDISSIEDVSMKKILTESSTQKCDLDTLIKAKDICHEIKEDEFNILGKQLVNDKLQSLKQRLTNKIQAASDITLLDQAHNKLIYLENIWQADPCLIPTMGKLKAIAQISKMMADDKSELATVFNDQVQLQIKSFKIKLLSLKPASEVNDSNLFIIGLDLIKDQMSHSLNQESTGEYNHLIQHLEQYCFSLTFVINSNPELITLESLSMIEDRFYHIKKLLINRFYLTDINAEHKKHWMALFANFKVIEKAIEARCYHQCKQRFVEIYSEKYLQDRIFSEIPKQIDENDIFNHISQIYSNTLTLKDEFNLSNRKRFIKLLLDKIEVYQLYSSRESANKLDHVIKQIQIDISEKQSSENAAVEIEKYLVKKANSAAITYLSNQQLFRYDLDKNEEKYITDDFNNLINKLCNLLASGTAETLDIFTTWCDAAILFFRDLKGSTSGFLASHWASTFLKSSSELLNTLIFDCDYELNLNSKLIEVLQTATLSISKCDSHSESELSVCKNLFTDIKNSAYQVNNYLYTDEAIKRYAEYSPREITRKRIQKLELDTEKEISLLFAEQSHIADKRHLRTSLVSSLPIMEEKLDHLDQATTVTEASLKCFERAHKIHLGVELKSADTIDSTITNLFNQFHSVETDKKDIILKKINLCIEKLTNEQLAGKQISDFTQQFVYWFQHEKQSCSGFLLLAAEQISKKLSEKYLELLKNNSDLNKHLAENNVNDLSYIHQISKLNNKFDISLAFYFNLHQQFATKKHGDAQAAVFTSLFQALKDLTTDQRFDRSTYFNLLDNLVEKTFKHGDKDATDQLISCMTAIPLTSLGFFTAEKCIDLLNKLISLSATNSSHDDILIQFTQLLLKRYVETVFLSKIDVTKPKDKSEQIAVRLIHYIDSITAIIQEKVVSDTTEPLDEYFAEVKSNIAFLQDIRKKGQEPDTRQLRKLLTVDEAIIVEKLDAKEVDTILHNEEPQQWENIFLNQYANKLGLTLEFKTQFSTAYQLAKQNGQVAAYIDCIATICEDKSLNSIKYLFQSIEKGANIDLLGNIMRRNKSTTTGISECLFSQITINLKHIIDKSKIQKSLKQQLTTLYLATLNTGSTGQLCLSVLLDAILFHKQNAKDYRLDTSFIRNMINLFAETNAHQDQEFLLTLKNKSITTCHKLLKRRKIILSLGIKDGSELQQSKLIDHFIQLKKQKSPKIIEKLLRSIQKFTKKGESLPLFAFSYMVHSFETNRWQLDDALLDKLDNSESIDNWSTIIDAHTKQIENKKEDRSLNELIQIMQSDAQSNVGVCDLLKSLDGSITKLAQRIAAIEKIAAELNSKSQDDIKSWAESFKLNGQENFKDEAKINELIAHMIHAVKLIKNQNIRYTQLIALICFIDSFDKNNGRFANISTGEGKSLITNLLAIASVMRGERVDIVTSSKVLAERDAMESAPLFDLFNINVSNNCDAEAEKDEDVRRQRYAASQVIYGETGTFQRDLLLTQYFDKNIRNAPGNRLILDEVDSACIDNAEKTLYISHSISDLCNLRELFLLIWSCVNGHDKHFATEKNITDIVEFIQTKISDKEISLPHTLKQFINRRLRMWVKSAYQAKNMSSGNQYITGKEGDVNGKAIIMDLDTGVEQLNTQWSHGLHQFVQLKNKEKLTDESLKAIFMSNLSFFRSYKGRINGMTGTLGQKKEKELLAKNYGVDFFTLPRYREERYIQEEGAVLGTEKAWLETIVEDVDQKMLGNDVESHDQAAAKAMLMEYKQKVVDNQLEFTKLQDAQTAKKTLHSKLLNELTNIKAELAKIPDTTAKQAEREALLKRQVSLESDLLLTQKELLQLTQNILAAKSNLEKSQSSLRNCEDIIENKKGRASLVICENVNRANDVMVALKAKYGDKKHIHLYDSALKPLDLKCLGPDDIVVATNIAGRGMDLGTTDCLEHNGGAHVILTYMPSNIRVETQAFRRTARQGKKGTGKFIVYDKRALEKSITIEFLRDERDEFEIQRLVEISRKGIKKIDREEMLFSHFSTLQTEIKQKLGSLYDKTKKLDKMIVKLQLKSLQNHWAFFLDEIENQLNQSDKYSEQDILAKYDQFKHDMWHLLSSGRFGLITEPAELIKLGKQYRDAKCYQPAEDCYDAVISKEPEFAGFAYYYKAMSILGQSQSQEAKQRSRSALKRARSLFETELSKLSSANQVINFLGKQKLIKGFGGSPDLFTKSNIERMVLINYHLQALKDNGGSELTPEALTNGVITGEEAKEILEKLCQHLNGNIIKGHRVSKKAKIIDGKLYYQDKLIEFPQEFNFCRNQVITILKDKIGKPSLAERTLSPNLFDHLMSLTQTDFLRGVQDHVFEQQVISVTPQYSVAVFGLWDEAVFQGHGKKIKEFVMSLKKPMTIDLFNEHIIKLTGLNESSTSAFLNLLQQKSIISLSTAYALTKPSHAEVKKYLEQITLKDNIQDKFAKLNLHKFPIFKGKEKYIRDKLFDIYKLAQKTVTNKDLELNGEQFKLLFALLKSNNYIHTPLTKLLNLDCKFPPDHHAEIEELIINFYEQGSICKDDLPLRENASDKSKLLWEKLREAKIIKAPTVKFSFSDNPKDRIEDIKNVIKDNIHNLIPDKGKKESQKYIDSISQALERVAGKIKTLDKAKLEKFSLQQYKTKLPPEILDFMIECCDDVISLVEKQSFWSWDAFACAMLGVAQITAGVIVEVLSAGSLTYLSNALINEGVGDIVFAVQNSINGTFSWEAYRSYKWQSLLITVATAGITAYASKSAQLEKLGTGVTKSVGKAIRNQVLLKCSQALLTAAVTVSADKLSQQATEIIFSIFEEELKHILEKDSHYKHAQLNIRNQFKKLHQRFGVDKATQIIERVLFDTTASLRSDIASKIGSKLSQFVQSLSGQFSALADQLSKTKSTNIAVVAELTVVLNKALKNINTINKVREIITLIPNFFHEFNKGLEKAYSTKLAETLAASSGQGDVEGFCESNSRAVTETILTQVKQTVKQTLIQDKIQEGLQYCVQPINDLMKNTLMAEVQQVGEEIDFEAKRDKIFQHEEKQQDVDEDTRTSYLSQAPDHHEERELPSQSLKQTSDKSESHHPSTQNPRSLFSLTPNDASMAPLGVALLGSTRKPPMEFNLLKDMSIAESQRRYHESFKRNPLFDNPLSRHPRNTSLPGSTQKPRMEFNLFKDMSIAESQRRYHEPFKGNPIFGKPLSTNLGKYDRVWTFQSKYNVVSQLDKNYSVTGSRVYYLAQDVHFQNKMPGAATSISYKLKSNKTVSYLLKKAPVALHYLHTGVEVFHLAHAGYEIYHQYNIDSKTGNFEKTKHVAAKEVGCLAGAWAGAEVGALVGAPGGPIGAGAGALIGGVGGCYAGSRAVDRVYPDTQLHPVQLNSYNKDLEKFVGTRFLVGDIRDLSALAGKKEQEKFTRPLQNSTSVVSRALDRQLPGSTPPAGESLAPINVRIFQNQLPKVSEPKLAEQPILNPETIHRMPFDF